MNSLQTNGSKDEQNTVLPGNLSGQRNAELKTWRYNCTICTTRTPLKTEGELKYSGRVISCWSTNVINEDGCFFLFLIIQSDELVQVIMYISVHCTLILKWLFVCFCFLFICFYFTWLCFSRFWFKWFNTLLYPLILLLIIKVILHQFWVKTFSPWKLNLEYGGTFSKLFMHVSSRNVFPTTRNLQIRVHVCCPRHCCGDWLTFGYFVPMIADHNLVKKSFGQMIPDHDLVNKR